MCAWKHRGLLLVVSSAKFTWCSLKSAFAYKAMLNSKVRPWPQTLHCSQQPVCIHRAGAFSIGGPRSQCPGWPQMRFLLSGEKRCQSVASLLTWLETDIGIKARDRDSWMIWTYLQTAPISSRHMSEACSPPSHKLSTQKGTVAFITSHVKSQQLQSQQTTRKDGSGL